MITELEVSNFRGRKVAHYAFGPGVNLIKGPNESGKSTIKEAICFLWSGTDSDGSKGPDHLISVGEQECFVAITTPKTRITRKKKRGTTSQIKMERGDLPAVALSQTDLSNQIKLSVEAFTSCWQVGYFMRLKNEQRLKVLSEVAKLDRRALFQSLTGGFPLEQLPPKVKFADPRIDAQVVADYRRQKQNQKASFEGELSQVLSQKQSFSSKESTLDVAAAEAKLKELSALLTAHEQYRFLSAQYSQAYASRKSAEENLSSLEAQENQIRAKLEVAEKEFNALDAKALELTSKISAGKTALELLNRSETPLPPAPKEPPALRLSGDCPTCGSLVTPERTEGIKKQYEHELMAYNQTCRQIENGNMEIRQAATKKTQELSLLQAELAGLDGARKKMIDSGQGLAGLRSELLSVQRYLEEARTALSKPPPSAPDVPPGQYEAIKTEHLELGMQIHTAKVFAKERERLLQKESELMAQISGLAVQIDQLAGIEKALLHLPQLETQKTLEVLKVPGVSLSLIEGELIVVDEKGVDYRSLSDGRRMKVDLALCVKLQDSAGPTAPRWLFIDNADLMDGKYDRALFSGRQVFIAQVDESVQEVTVVPL